MKRYKYLILIPARGGSKGIHRKNLVSICGTPLVDFSISAAIKAEIELSKVVLSTDDKEIVDNCRKFKGLEIPFIRPENISGDKALTSDVIKHTIEWYLRYKKTTFDSIILIQPTCPFRNQLHIFQSIELFENSKEPSLISVNEVREHPCEYLIEDDTGFSYVLNPPIVSIRQNFPKVYFINGAIYIFDCSWFLNTGKIFNTSSVLYKMDSKYTIDIDEMQDVYLAESYLKHYSELKSFQKNIYNGIC